MLKKLRIKFICINMLIVTVMLCIIFGLVFNFTQANLESQSLSMMKAIAENPLQLRSPDEYPASVSLPYFAMQIGTRGELVAVSGGYFDLSDEDFLKEMLRQVLSSGKTSGIIQQYNLRYYWDIRPSSQCLVFADISSELETLSALLRNSVIIGILAMGLFLALSIWLSSWAVRPVDKAWKMQQQFVADASHELKTPLTVIMTNAELLQDQQYSSQQKGGFSRNILTMSQQMRSLVEGLLELARADRAQTLSSFETVDFSQLVSDHAMIFEPLIFEKGLELESSIEPGILLKGDSQSLSRTLDILLDNACKYCPDSGKIRLQLKMQSRSHCLLSISNPGHLSKQQLQDIFTRFYRVDPARSRDGSYGLGLSIAQSNVQRHSGRIWAQCVQDIISFNISLPVIRQ